MKKLVVSLATLVTLSALSTFAAFVWPTEWRYEKIESSEYARLIRVNRFDGRAEVLVPSGWRPMGGKPKSGLSETAISSLEGERPQSEKRLLSCEEYAKKKDNAFIHVRYRIPENCP